jgi:ketosteroid isomerase-like protein
MRSRSRPDAMEDLMKRVLIPFLLSAALTTPLAAQTSPAPTPAELRETLPRFADAWKNGQFQALATDLTADFALLVPAASFQGREILEAEWPRARGHTGSLYVPTDFVRDGDRILETGRTHLISTVAADPLHDEPMCTPEYPGYEAQPASYLREWVRTPDGSWKVKSLVLQRS